jgi:hypothetical protein
MPRSCGYGTRFVGSPISRYLPPSSSRFTPGVGRTGPRKRPEDLLREVQIVGRSKLATVESDSHTVAREQEHADVSPMDRRHFRDETRNILRVQAAWHLTVVRKTDPPGFACAILANIAETMNLQQFSSPASEGSPLRPSR